MRRKFPRLIAVYSDSIVIDREWLADLGHTEIFHDLESYKQSPLVSKIAFTAHRLHVEHDKDMSFERKVLSLSEHSTLVFCIESELHNFHWNIWRRCHRPNVYWIMPGTVNDSQDMRDHMIFWGDFFKTNSSLYKTLPHRLDRLRPYDIKPKYFDALLGSKKPHRNFVYDSIMGSGEQDKFIVTYGGDWKNDKFYAEDYFLWEPDCEPCGPIIGTADYVKFEGVLTHLSQVIPTDVYNQTAYSVVTETDHDNSLSFFSEKTAKVLIARRLFVVFSGYRFLHNLRQQGFRTFGDVIDESYDLIRNDGERYSKAFEQVQKLLKLDQTQVYGAIRDVVEHNHDVIMNTDWTAKARGGVTEIVSKYLPNAGA